MKLMPEVPTEEILSNIATRHEVSIEEAGYLYSDVYENAPSVECEPVAWQYFEEYPDSTNKWWNAEEGDDKDAISECHPVRDLYTIPQDQSAKIAELEADKQKLIEALDMSAEDAKDWAMQYVTEDNAPVNVKEFVSSKFEKLLSEMKKG
jgi:hypothetical protein